eukprot:TRINITY_DN25840_c0_g1_i1.p2 TRINITY_DN25840_c0_g1~~TRINITY_DN25840_c0_g1_i1.p2  ORF type:complete len:103 (+),score=1.27 TRINITY_DN25840_c0_g1_i1:26-334(+)
MRSISNKIEQSSVRVSHCWILHSVTKKKDESTIESVEKCANTLQTPWIGEHLAFVQTPPIHAEHEHNDEFSDIFHAYSIGYTVSPQMTKNKFEIMLSRTQDS